MKEKFVLKMINASNETHYRKFNADLNGFKWTEDINFSFDFETYENCLEAIKNIMKQNYTRGIHYSVEKYFVCI